MYMSLLKSASKNSLVSSDIIHKSPLNNVDSRQLLNVPNPDFINFKEISKDFTDIIQQNEGILS